VRSLHLLQRLERIRRNQEVLAQLGICQMAQDLVSTCNQPAPQQGGAAGTQRQSRPREVRNLLYVSVTFGLNFDELPVLSTTGMRGRVEVIGSQGEQLSGAGGAQ